MAKRFLICGGCGFIGSSFAKHLWLKYPDSEITVIDVLTYAGSLDNLGELHAESRLQFLEADICDVGALPKLEDVQFDLVVNFAAETHVDRSLYYTSEFVRTNVLGTDSLLSFCRKTDSPMLQISTDEVYGPARENETLSEAAPLNPSSPYAASKASADLLVLAAIKTFEQKAAIARTSNNYGPRQFPEKLIPYFIYLARQGKPLPVYGDGKQRRSWLYVDDFCSALLRVVDDFPKGEILNIGATREYANLEVVRRLTALLECEALVNHVADRPAHDRCYRIDSRKFEQRYGRIDERDLADGLRQTVAWYQSHPEIFDRLRAQDAVSFRDKHYRNRT
ncbi:MAG: GDP-mannose 4,6-dehydratase [candidate division Zixibacteria bacterium]|nr:GDP-mannose 4,6-dehydratase [candidate division Zixibacteria bacterium]